MFVSILDFSASVSTNQQQIVTHIVKSSRTCLELTQSNLPPTTVLEWMGLPRTCLWPILYNDRTNYLACNNEHVIVQGKGCFIWQKTNKYCLYITLWPSPSWGKACKRICLSPSEYPSPSWYVVPNIFESMSVEQNAAFILFLFISSLSFLLSIS